MRLLALLLPVWVIVGVGMNRLSEPEQTPTPGNVTPACVWAPGLAESQCVRGRSIYNRQGGRWVYGGPVTPADPHLPRGDR